MLRLAVLAAFALLAAAIGWAFSAADFWASFARIVADPWGIVSLVDLYAGFLIAAIIMARFEPNRPLAVALIALTPFLGNLVPLAWLGWRGLERVVPGR